MCVSGGGCLQRQGYNSTVCLHVPSQLQSVESRVCVYPTACDSYPTESTVACFPIIHMQL